MRESLEYRAARTLASPGEAGVEVVEERIMNKYAAMLAAAAFLALPLSAYADTSPLVNRVIVNQALQQQMQNQLDTQQAQLQTQQEQMRANLQSQLQQNTMTLQCLLLQQQLDLLKLQQRSHKHTSAARRPRP